jgi:triosephosphate isomerase (TIM)
MNTQRIPFVAGNWKMNKGPDEAKRFAEELLRAIPNDKTRVTNSRQHVEVAVFPPFTSLSAVADILKGTPVAYGGQNCHWEPSGAFTGETAPDFLAELACRYVLVGHSERRTMFAESDEICRKKLLAVVAAGMQPILCCGETLSERESGLTFGVIERQLQVALASLSPAVPLAVAYEPIWAIGTGRSATPTQAGEAHSFIRGWLGHNLSLETSERTRLLYGGSVKPDNFTDLLKQPDVDGALVGGASLEVASFCGIVNSARSYLTGLI